MCVHVRVTVELDPLFDVQVAALARRFLHHLSPPTVVSSMLPTTNPCTFTASSDVTTNRTHASSTIAMSIARTKVIVLSAIVDYGYMRAGRNGK